MEQVPTYHRNPWDDGDSSLGTIRNVLAIAEKTGHLRRNEIPTHEEILEDAYDNSRSLKLMTALKSIEDTRKQIDRVNLEIQTRLLDKETKDVTNMEIMERRIGMVNKLNSHLQAVVSKKDQLVSKLQQPYAGDYLRIDADYMSYLCSITPDLVTVLSELTLQLDNIEWAHKQDFSHTQLEQVLRNVTSSLSQLRLDFQGCCQMHKTAVEKHRQIEKNN